MHYLLYKINSFFFLLEFFVYRENKQSIGKNIFCSFLMCKMKLGKKNIISMKKKSASER